MDWLNSGRYDSFRYMRVEKTTMRETEELTNFIGGGTIEYNDFTTIKVSGSLPFIEPPDIGFDYLRVYSISTLNGETIEVLHGTFIVSTPSSDIKGRTRTGTAAIYSLLQIPHDAATEKPLFIPAGTNCISFARGILESLGLEVIADTSTAMLVNPANFEAGTNWLEIVNELCKTAGFNSANVDAAGKIRLTLYTDTALRAPTIEFIDDNRCVFDPTLKYDFDLFDVPNVVVAIMSNQDEVMTAVAKNNDPFSVYSIPSRGREITYTESVNDIADWWALYALASRRLAEKSSAVESVEVSHPFIPYEPGDVGYFNYTLADFEFIGTAVKKSIKLHNGMPCQSRFRRFIRNVSEGQPPGIGVVTSTAAMSVFSTSALTTGTDFITFPADTECVLHSVLLTDASTTNGTGIQLEVEYNGIRGWVQNNSTFRTVFHKSSLYTSTGSVTMYSEGATTPSGNVSGTPCRWTVFDELGKYWKARLDRSGTNGATIIEYRYGYVLKSVLTSV